MTLPLSFDTMSPSLGRLKSSSTPNCVMKSAVIYEPVSGSLNLPRYPLMFLERTLPAAIDFVVTLKESVLISNLSMSLVIDVPMVPVESSHDDIIRVTSSALARVFSFM